MKINWKATAASLAVLIGVSGAAWGQDLDHRDRDDRARVEHNDRDHDRRWDRDRDHDRNWNNRRYGWSGDHDRDDRRVYNYNPYYGYNNGYYRGYER